MASCSSVLGFLFLIAAVVCCAVSYGTPFWVKFDNSSANYGLWQYCNSSSNNSCADFEHVEDWYNMVRVAFSIALLMLVLDFFAAICYFTCNCCKAHRAIQLMVLILLVALLAEVVALLTFGIKSNDSSNMPVKFKGDTHFAWSYHVGIGAVAASLLSFVFYVCEVPKARRVAAYEPIRPTSAS